MKQTLVIKALRILLLATLLFALPTNLYSQSNDREPNSLSLTEDTVLNPIDRILDSANGNVEIIISQDLIEKILKSPSSHKKTTGPIQQRIRPGINKISGYRIQVFADGRNQHSLEARAKARGSGIVARFPKYRGQVYTFSSSPNWFTRVGNFRSQSEANEALAELRSAFPAFANEMRIVKSQIVIIK